jgi:hypothetical protein
MEEFDYMNHHVSVWHEGAGVYRFKITGADGWVCDGAETRRKPVVFAIIKRIIVRRSN